MRISPYLIFVVLFLLLTSVSAQTRPATKPNVTNFPSVKPPKLQTSLGGYKDTSTVNLETARKIVTEKLKIFDDKNTEYAISSYQFLYKKLGVAPDESGKKNVVVSSISANRFKVTPLPELWVNLVKEQLKAGEEFFYFEVIAKDAQGRVMYAPDLKILIK